MSRRPSSYPHPVLGINDDIQGKFACSLPSVDVGVEYTEIAISELHCSNQSIAMAISKRVAAFTLTYRCGATFLRGAVSSYIGELRHRIPNSRLSGRVELALQICLQTDTNWAPDGLHPDYKGTSFELPRGAIVAVGQEFSFELPDEFDPLTGSVASLFTVIQTNEESGPARLRFEADNRIQILLSKTEHSQFNKTKARLPGLIHAGLAYPALVEAIVRLRTPTDGDEEKTWHQRLTAILEQRECDIADPFASASRILGRPFERSSVEALSVVQAGDDE